MKTLRFALPLLFLLSLSAFGQHAKVVELKPEDAAKAKQLHAAVQAAQKAADDFDKIIGKRYTGHPVGTNAPGAFLTGSEWDFGFEFSENFRFIVPKQILWRDGGTAAVLDMHSCTTTALEGINLN